MTSEELVKEKTMLAVLLRYHQSSLNSAAARVSSGDLQVWIYLNTPNSGDCYHVTVRLFIDLNNFQNLHNYYVQNLYNYFFS